MGSEFDLIKFDFIFSLVCINSSTFRTSSSSTLVTLIPSPRIFFQKDCFIADEHLSFISMVEVISLNLFWVPNKLTLVRPKSKFVCFQMLDISRTPPNPKMREYWLTTYPYLMWCFIYSLTQNFIK